MTDEKEVSKSEALNKKILELQFLTFKFANLWAQSALVGFFFREKVREEAFEARTQADDLRGKLVKEIIEQAEREKAEYFEAGKQRGFYETEVLNFNDHVPDFEEYKTQKGQPPPYRCNACSGHDKAYIAGATDQQSTFEAQLEQRKDRCPYCGGTEFHTVSPIHIPGNWKAVSRNGVCVECHEAFKKQLEMARREGFKVGIAKANAWHFIGKGHRCEVLESVLEAEDDYIADYKKQNGG